MKIPIEASLERPRNAREPARVAEVPQDAIAIGIKQGVDERQLGPGVKEKRVHASTSPLSHAVNAGCDLHVVVPSNPITMAGS